MTQPRLPARQSRRSSGTPVAASLIRGIRVSAWSPRARSSRTASSCHGKSNSTLMSHRSGRPFERLVAHFKSWRIFHTDYRRPYHTYRRRAMTPLAGCSSSHSTGVLNKVPYRCYAGNATGLFPEEMSAARQRRHRHRYHQLPPERPDHRAEYTQTHAIECARRESRTPRPTWLLSRSSQITPSGVMSGWCAQRPGAATWPVRIGGSGR